MGKCLNSCCFSPLPLKVGCVAISVYFIVCGLFYLIFALYIIYFTVTHGETDSFNFQSACLTAISGVLSVVLGFWIKSDTMKKDSMALKTWAILLLVVNPLGIAIYFFFGGNVNPFIICYIIVHFVLAVYFALILWSYGEECSETQGTNVPEEANQEQQEV